ncbi:DUF3263 domain-containing protein [Rhodococcus sp. NPDC019627]|jgi:hypothetical protein|uniref:DUF3263 domain-containing protein n=1 Tax=unclassified Rhodococcus (in: high G+C Gram-positive bacteria) TaxID=192944 RepID=UPI0034116A93
MTPDDQVLLDYARKWAPYGGPRRGDILVEFGMSPARFYVQLQRILDSVLVTNMSPGELVRLHAVVNSQPGIP